MNLRINCCFIVNLPGFVGNFYLSCLVSRVDNLFKLQKILERSVTSNMSWIISKSIKNHLLGLEGLLTLFDRKLQKATTMIVPCDFLEYLGRDRRVFDGVKTHLGLKR